MEGLYFPVKKLSRKYLRFLFLDTRNYYADRVFANSGVAVRFDDELINPKNQYIWRFCTIKKSDEKKFLSALETLKRNLFVCGFTDCEDEFRALKRMMDE